jgi:hypothetical protein
VQLAIRYIGDEPYSGRPARIFQAVGTTLQGVVEPRDLVAEDRIADEVATAERRHAR